MSVPGFLALEGGRGGTPAFLEEEADLVAAGQEVVVADMVLLGSGACGESGHGVR